MEVSEFLFIFVCKILAAAAAAAKLIYREARVLMFLQNLLQFWLISMDGYVYLAS